MTGAQKTREEDTAVSVLKEKRTTSKAEYVNTANQIYVKTVDFLSRLSARYSRLIAADTARLAGQVMDHAEQANKIFPSDAQRKELRKAHHLEAMAALSALDVRLTNCYEILYCKPAGRFYRQQGKERTAQGGRGAAGPHGSRAGRADRPGGNPAAEHHGERQETEIGHNWVYF